MKNRGVAMALAVALMGFFALMLSTFSARVRAVVVRTEAAGNEAQASQLIRAAIQIAIAQQHDGHATSGAVPAPVGQITLNWTPVEGSVDRRCTIDVTLPHLHRTTDLQFDAAGAARLIQ